MIFNQVNLAIDLKTQSRLREWFSMRGTGMSNNIEISSIGLGDSDIDYERIGENQYILHSPFEVPGIKHKLLYAGDLTGVTSDITCYLRRVYDDTIYFESEASPNYYIWTASEDIPTSLLVAQPNYDWDTIPFDINLTGPGTGAEGYICYFQTLPVGFEIGNEQARYPELYDFTFLNIPNTWEIIIDEAYGSLLIAKPADYVFIGSTGVITAKGKDTGVTKTLTFNI